MDDGANVIAIASVMEPTPELAAYLDAGRRRAAGAMTPEQRAAMPLMLFDMVAEAIRAGIRLDHPQAGEEEVFRLFSERMRAMRREQRR